jgi:hypothetical protein
MSGAQSYRAGRSYRQEWNRAVFGPSVNHPPFEALWVTRQGDLMVASVPLFGEGTGNPGWSSTEEQTTTLYRGTTKVGEGTEYTDLPAAAATYRLESVAKRGAPHTLSTEVRGVWTFRAGHVEGEAFRRLPLSTVRFSPRLDQHNTAPAGRTFEIPVTVDQQVGSTAGTARDVRVDVSYDDGRTWQKAAVRGQGDHRIATVRHPQGAQFVSLRVTAGDGRGNRVAQTVIRAYALR